MEALGKISPCWSWGRVFLESRNIQTHQNGGGGWSKLGRTWMSTFSSGKKRSLTHFSTSSCFYAFRNEPAEPTNPRHRCTRTVWAETHLSNTFCTPLQLQAWSLKASRLLYTIPTASGTIVQTSFSCTSTLYQEICDTCVRGTQARFIPWSIKTNDIRNFQVTSIFFLLIHPQ